MTTIQLQPRRCFILCHAICLLAGIGQFVATAQPAPNVAWSKQTHNYFVSPVAISPDGALVASSGTNNSIRLANLADGSAVLHLVGHTAGVASIAFSPDGSWLASTAADRTMRLWTVPGGRLWRTIPQGGGNRQFTSVAFHPDGKHVVADRHRTNVVLWSVADGTPVWETAGNNSEIESIACSPDGSWVAAAGGYRGLDVAIRIIRASDGQLLHTLTTSNSYGVRQLAFSPDGQWLAAGCDRLTNFRGEVELWRVATWQRVRTLPVHSPTLAFSSDGKLLVTLQQKTMKLWRMPEGSLMHTLGVPDDGNYSPHHSIAVSLRRDRIVTGNYKHIATPNGTLAEGTTFAFRFPIALGISRQTGNFATFNWTGDYPLYQIQHRSFGSSSWVNLGEPATNQSITLPLESPGEMFRVIGMAQ